MTFAPRTLQELATYWARNGGVNLGIVGDAPHIGRGVSYHLGRDQLRPDAYSVQTARDRAGLSNAASAIDLGKLNGSFPQLRRFSDDLARRCVKGQPGTRDVREVIYSPDGRRVLGFKDGVDFLIPSYGDASHLTHTHISFYRDSELRDKRPLFAPYFAEAAVINFTWLTGEPTSPAGTVTIIEDKVSAILANGTLLALPKGTEKHAYGLVRFKGGTWSGQDAYAIGDDCAFLLARNVIWSADLTP